MAHLSSGGADVAVAVVTVVVVCAIIGGDGALQISCSLSCSFNIILKYHNALMEVMIFLFLFFSLTSLQLLYDFFTFFPFSNTFILYCFCFFFCIRRVQDVAFYFYYYLYTHKKQTKVSSFSYKNNGLQISYLRMKNFLMMMIIMMMRVWTFTNVVCAFHRFMIQSQSRRGPKKGFTEYEMLVNHHQLFQLIINFFDT